MIRFLSSDGEIAFVMGHEIGHAVDQTRHGIKQNDLSARRNCESRADAVAFDLLIIIGPVRWFTIGWRIDRTDGVVGMPGS